MGVLLLATYYLFLDELKSSTKYKYFILAGCIIEYDTYNGIIIPYITDLKKKVFGDETVVLHETEVRYAKNGLYKTMKNADKREEFWNGMQELFSKPDVFHTIGVGIDCNEYKRLYNSQHRCNEYYVGLQIIIENFAHFLELNNAKGAVYIESRNPTEDEKLQNHYHTLKANGTLFIDKNAIQKRLGPISFPLKTDNNIGLQIADFIPNPLARHLCGIPQRKPSLYDHIANKLYDGNAGLSNRFGLKIIP
jgi:hypothetical protein